MAEQGQIERVLVNLLDNAIKYSPGGGEIVISIATAPEWAEMTVRDRGVGIPAIDLPRLFEPLHRASNVRDSFPGTGIGLAGAKRIVEQHAGTIAVASVEGAGSAFVVRLPLVEDRGDGAS